MAVNCYRFGLSKPLNSLTSILIPLQLRHRQRTHDSQNKQCEMQNKANAYQSKSTAIVSMASDNHHAWKRKKQKYHLFKCDNGRQGTTRGETDDLNATRLYFMKVNSNQSIDIAKDLNKPLYTKRTTNNTSAMWRESSLFFFLHRVMHAAIFAPSPYILNVVFLEIESILWDWLRPYTRNFVDVFHTLLTSHSQH